MPDGTLTIKSKLDNSDFEKKLRKLESEIQDLHNELENMELNPNKTTQALQIIQKKIQQTVKEYNEMIKAKDKALSTKVTGSRKAGEGAVGKALSSSPLAPQTVKTTEQSIKSISVETDKVEGKMSKVLKTVTKWGLAVFGIRSAYLAIRKATSIISQYDKQMGANLEYLQYALAMTLKPVIEWLINAVYTLLSYIGSIVYQFSGINIFANSTAKAFNKANKSASVLKKTMTSFDEMNTVQDSSSGGSANLTPTMDLSKLANVDLTGITKLLDKIKSMVDTGIAKVKENVIKVITDFGFSNLFIKGWKLLIDSVGEMLKGLIDVVGGVLEICIGLFTGNTELVREGLKNLLGGLVDMLTGFVGFVGGMLLEIIAIIKDTLVAIGKWIYNSFIKPVADWFIGLGKSIGNVFVGAWNGLVSGAASAWTGIKNVFSSVGTFFKDTFTNAWTKVKNVFSTGGKIFDGIKDGIVSAFKSIVNALIKGINKVVSLPFNTLNSTLNSIRNVEVLGVKPFKSLWGKNPISVPQIPTLAVGGIVNMPGAGTYYGGAMIGERGPEGVIPLTNSEMMTQLGEAIGRYITINANITNTMNGRVISRELQRVNNASDFASNR